MICPRQILKTTTYNLYFSKTAVFRKIYFVIMIASPTSDKVIVHNNLVVNNIRTFARYVGTINYEKMVRANKTMEAGLFSPIATKVSAEDRAKLEIIAHDFNMSVYELLQGLLLSLVRYFDTPSTATQEHSEMINAFVSTMFALKGSFNPLAMRDRKRECIAKAILLVERPKKQPQLISIINDGSGDLKESYNFETMLSDFLGVFDPQALQVLTHLKKELGSFSLTHTLHETLMQMKPAPADTIGEEIQKEFGDIRIATGDKTNENIHYKRPYTHWESCTAPTMPKKPVRTSYLNL